MMEEKLVYLCHVQGVFISFIIKSRKTSCREPVPVYSIGFYFGKTPYGERRLVELHI